MASRTVKVVGAVVVVIVVIAVVAAVAFSSSDDDSEKNQVRYNYDIQLADSFTGDSGRSYSAGTGYQWAIVTYTVANDGWENGISENYYNFDFKLSVGGVSCSVSNYTDYYPGYDYNLRIDAGATASFTYVYKLSDDATLDGITVVPDYWIIGTGPTFVYDPSLRNLFRNPLPSFSIDCAMPVTWPRTSRT